MGLDPGDLRLVRDAADAVRDEHRYERRVRYLECAEVEEVDPDTGLFRLGAGRTLDADSSWESARVLQYLPLPGEEPHGSNGLSLATAVADRVDVDEPAARWNAGWQADIVEVDDVAGSLYVDVAHSAIDPAPGRFEVQPFEFLATLDSLYDTAASSALGPILAAALRATRQPASGRALDSSGAALAGLESLWGHAWSVLWGPLGTGKTYTIGHVEVRFNSTRSLTISTISVAGGLVAAGTAQDPIVFTSNLATPAPGNWRGSGRCCGVRACTRRI